MITDNDEKIYFVPSLLKTAYHACNQTQRNKFDELDSLDVDLKICCKLLFQIIKQNTESGDFDALGDRRSIFGKANVANKNPIKNICEKAAFHGHIDCMKFAREIGVPWYNSSNLNSLSACDEAAMSGNLNCLKYAHENGSQFGGNIISLAVAAGHLDCLMYLNENGCLMDEETCSRAAAGGYLNCLKYAHENGCPWDEDTCYWAAFHGYLDILKYAHENGCLWAGNTTCVAVSLKRLDCLKYALENGCPIWDQVLEKAQLMWPSLEYSPNIES